MTTRSKSRGRRQYDDNDNMRTMSRRRTRSSSRNNNNNNKTPTSSRRKTPSNYRRGKTPSSSSLRRRSSNISQNKSVDSINGSPMAPVLNVLKYIFNIVYGILHHIYILLYFIFVLIVGRERYDLSAINNEYELLIKAIKELEYLLDSNCNYHDIEDDGDDSDIINPEEDNRPVQGIFAKLHRFHIKNKHLPKKIIRKVLYINTLRNKLVHSYDTTCLEFNQINTIKETYAECHRDILKFIKKLEKR